MEKITLYSTTLLPEFQTYFNDWVQAKCSYHWWYNLLNSTGVVEYNNGYTEIGIKSNGNTYYMCIIASETPHEVKFTETFRRNIKLIESFRYFLANLERIEKIKMITR